MIKINNFRYIGTPKASKWIKKTLTHRFNMLMGPVRSSKDYNATIAFVEQVKRADYDLFMIGAVDVKNSVRIIGRYILDYLGGLAKRTNYMEAPAIQFPYNGMTKTIIFAGGRNNGSDAGIQGLTLHSIYLTEINLLNEDFINQAIKRTSSFRDAKIYGTMNPKGPKHYFRLQFLNIWEQYHKQHPEKNWLNFERFTLYDNPVLDAEMIDMIKASYDPNSVSYKRDIEGLETDPEGALYTIRDYNEIDIDISQYTRYITLLDLGESVSATAFTLAAPYYDKERNQWELHILKEYHHLNDKLNDLQKKSPLNYISDYVTFIKEAIELFRGKHPEKILFDGTDQVLRDIQKELRQNKLGQHVPKGVDKDKNEDRIYRQQSLLYQAKLRFNKNCKKSIEDMRNATYDEKVYERTGVINRKEDFNDLGHGDLLDNIDYASTFYKFLVK
jgi:PBSX family phage terminase large subunit